MSDYSIPIDPRKIVETSRFNRGAVACESLKITDWEATEIELWCNWIQRELTDAKAEIERLRHGDNQSMLKSPSQICSLHSVQNCHFCERMECCDNMSTAKAEIAKLTECVRAADELSEDVRCELPQIEADSIRSTARSLVQAVRKYDAARKQVKI